MQPPDTPAMPGSLDRVLIVNPVDPAMGPRFSCRPLTAHNQEKSTAFGAFTGQIGLSDVPEFTAAMYDLASKNPLKVILDFSGLSLTKSAAGALVAFATAMHGRNKKLYLYRTSAQIRGVLKELKLLPYFSFLETEDDIFVSSVA